MHKDSFKIAKNKARSWLYGLMDTKQKTKEEDRKRSQKKILER